MPSTEGIGVRTAELGPAGDQELRVYVRHASPWGAERAALNVQSEMGITGTTLNTSRNQHQHAQKPKNGDKRG